MFWSFCGRVLESSCVGELLPLKYSSLLGCCTVFLVCSIPEALGPPKHWQLYTNRHSMTSQQTWSLASTAVKILNVPALHFSWNCGFISVYLIISIAYEYPQFPPADLWRLMSFSAFLVWCQLTWCYGGRYITVFGISISFTFAAFIFVTYSKWPCIKCLLIEWFWVSFSGLYQIGFRFCKE